MLFIWSMNGMVVWWMKLSVLPHGAYLSILQPPETHVQVNLGLCGDLNVLSFIFKNLFGTSKY